MTSSHDPARDAALRQAMAAEGLDAILAFFPEDLLMVAGTWPCLGMNLCLYPREGQPVYYMSPPEPPDVCPQDFLCRRFAIEPGSWSGLRALLKDDIARLGLGAGGIGTATDGGQHAVTSFPGETTVFGASALALILEGFGTRDATTLFTRAGLIKTRAEIERIRRANKVAGAGLEAFHASLEPGRSEAEVAALVEGAIQSRSGLDGSGLARGWAHVQAGPNCHLGGTWSRSSGYRLAEGDLVLIELGTCVDGYWSDLTRTAPVGRAGVPQRDLMIAVQGAQAAAIAAVRPGASHEEVDRAARDHLEARGLGEGFKHATGHHIGFRYHERGPVLAAGQKALLEAGMILTIEPGSYGSPSLGGSRFEDDVLVTGSGAEILSPRQTAWKA